LTISSLRTFLSPPYCILDRLYPVRHFLVPIVFVLVLNHVLNLKLYWIVIRHNLDFIDNI
jgi:hypothetical protein